MSAVAMTKYLRALLLLAAFLSAQSCAATQPATDRSIVMVSIQPQQEFVARVGGERVDITVMVPPGASPHTYEVTPAQMVKLSQAKAYFKVGSPIEFELAWLDRLTAANRKMAVIDCSRGIYLMQSDDPDEPGLDPHIWTAPRNVKIIVENICAGLSAVDPAGQAYFEANRNSYLKELDVLDADIRKALENVANRTFIVYHPAWGYFARDYGLQQLGIEQEGKEPKAAYLARLVQEAKARGIQVIFVSPEFDTRSAGAVAREINGRVVIIDPLAPDYMNNLSQVASTLREALNQ